jgi:biopolymer transport protein ExbD
MARKPSERRHSKEKIEDLNLSPIMSILVILIPMLLYAFSFFEVKVQAVTAPRMGQSKPTKDKEEEEKPLNLTVLVTSKGFVGQAAGRAHQRAREAHLQALVQRRRGGV